ncbi:MAG: hypothetical protein GVY24_04315 [Planctomycetes bacterium]|jgi:hypothetical protein|nr:hypothetical protein [Planctomycetota bacterium]
MRRLPLALLLHTASHGRHYDLLVLDPTAPDDAEHRLWAARLSLPPDRWADHRRLRLTPLPPHRMRYLTYEGPLTRGRGHVRRVDRGHARARLWTPRRIVLDVTLHRFRGRVTLMRHGPDAWHAVAQRSLVGSAGMR